MLVLVETIVSSCRAGGSFSFLAYKSFSSGLLKFLFSHTNVFFRTSCHFLKGFPGFRHSAPLLPGSALRQVQGPPPVSNGYAAPPIPAVFSCQDKKILRRRGAPLVPRKRDEGYRRAEGR